MKVLSSLLILFWFSLTVTVAQQPAPEAKPDLSGTWVFNARKSKLKMPAPDSLTLRIEQKDAHVQFARTQTYSGHAFDWKFESAIDGKEVVQKDPQYTASIRVYWQGDALVLDQKVTATDGTVATDVVTYNLEPDGRTLLGMERQETVGASGGATNKWVYERQAQ